MTEPENAWSKTAFHAGILCVTGVVVCLVFYYIS